METKVRMRQNGFIEEVVAVKSLTANNGCTRSIFIYIYITLQKLATTDKALHMIPDGYLSLGYGLPLLGGRV